MSEIRLLRDDTNDTTRWKGNSSGSGNVQLTGSNFEAAQGAALPSRAALISGVGVSGDVRSPVVRGITDAAADYYALIAESRLMAYTGAGGWDRWRNNTEGTLLASAARTASVNSADLTVYNGAKLTVYLDVTAASGTSPTLDVTVKAKDPASGKYFTIGTFTQKTGVTSDAIFIGGGADVEFAVRTLRVECVIGGTTPSFTFSVGYSATTA